MASITIGIPTYRRPAYLRRAVESALAQDQGDIEVVISDNGSGDETDSLCRALVASDARVRYLPHPENLGSHHNFLAVLHAATGEHFMWLGDDDWIDPGYVSACLRALAAPGVALAAGVSSEYHASVWSGEHLPAAVLDDDAADRVAHYYWTVQQNSQFYGVMKRETILACDLTNTLGGDWMLIAQVAFLGKIAIVPEVRVHRERAVRTSSSYANIVRSLGLPRIHAVLPAASIAGSAARDIIRGEVYAELSLGDRAALAARVSAILMARLAVWAPIRRTLSPVIGPERARRWKASVLAAIGLRRS